MLLSEPPRVPDALELLGELQNQDRGPEVRGLGASL